MDLKVDDQQVICFDLDDTLYNELDFLRSAYAEIARNLEPEQSNDLYSKIFSLYRQGENTFDYLIRNYRISKEELLAQYRNHMPLLSPFPGVRELMEQIKSKGGYLVCITDGRSVTQRNKLQALEILDTFDLLVISEEIGSTKPAELNYTLVEEHFSQKQYTYIADNLKKDFLVPNQRGWGSIGLIDNGKNIHYHASDYVENPIHRPKHFVKYLTEIQIS